MAGSDDQPPEHGADNQPSHREEGDSSRPKSVAEEVSRTLGARSAAEEAARTLGTRSAAEEAASNLKYANETRRIAKKDPASNPKYDGQGAGSAANTPPETTSSTSQKADSEILKRRRDGRWMSMIAVGVMGAFVVGFFSIASCFAWRFFHLYLEHLQGVEDSGQGAAETAVTGVDGILPFIVPMMPAFFFSLLGLVTLVTCTRFIASYVNSTNDDSDDANLVERVAREIAGIIKAWRGGN